MTAGRAPRYTVSDFSLEINDQMHQCANHICHNFQMVGTYGRKSVEALKVIKLNTTKLQRALRNLYEMKGTTYSNITATSGVHNIGRLRSGQIKPTAHTWWRLHKAYPSIIPPPEYVDAEGAVVTTLTASSNDAVSANAANLTPAQLKFFVVCDTLFSTDEEWEKLLGVALDFYRSPRSSD